MPLLRAEAERAVHERGSDAIETAEAWNLLGVACKFAGRLDEAAAAYANALLGAEGHEVEEPDLLATLSHNLGGLAHARGRFEEAEMHARRGLDLRIARGSDRAALASDVAGLAAIIEGQERWAEAESLYRRAIDGWEAEGDAYEAAMALNGLAAVVRFAGRPAEAEPMFRRALAVVEAERGPAHPDASTVRNNLAMLLNATGRSREALVLLEQAAADMVAVLGPDHPATRDVVANRDRVSASLEP